MDFQGFFVDIFSKNGFYDSKMQGDFWSAPQHGIIQKSSNLQHKKCSVLLLGALGRLNSTVLIRY
jgi:hypothetical protein